MSILLLYFCLHLFTFSSRKLFYTSQYGPSHFCLYHMENLKKTCSTTRPIRSNDAPFQKSLSLVSHTGCFMTLCNNYKMLFLRPFSVKNFISIWVPFSAVTELWLGENAVGWNVRISCIDFPLICGVVQMRISSLDHSFWRDSLSRVLGRGLPGPLEAVPLKTRIFGTFFFTAVKVQGM
jgi:hypothetical protein